MSSVTNRKVALASAALISCILIVAGVVTFIFDSNSQKIDVGPTSFSRSSISYSGVGQRNLKLKFNLYGDEIRTIVATVQLPDNLDLSGHSLTYKWQLDEKVMSLRDVTQGEIKIDGSMKILEIPIEVNNFSQKQKRFVRFEARVEAKDHRFFGDGIVSSQEQSSFEVFVRGIEDFKKREKLND